MKQSFKFLGFEINTKKFLITMACVVIVLGLLFIVDAFWVPVSWYGVLIGAGFLMALAVCCGLAKYRGFNSDYPFDLIWWIFPLSIIGARVYYVISEWDSFDTFWDMCKVWEGGMAIYGGIIGGLLGLIICSLIKKKSIINAMDLAAPGLILAQSIGRWGNFINQEVYGFRVVNPAWQWFPATVKVGDSFYLATFFYESILNFAGFFLLLWLIRKSKEKGIVTSVYLMFYGAVRICLESLRLPEYILYIRGTNIPISSVVSGCIILTGLIWLIVILVKRKKRMRHEEIIRRLIDVDERAEKMAESINKSTMQKPKKKRE